jgi:hypothetical protein
LAALATPLALDAADELARAGEAEGRQVLESAARHPDAAVRRRALARLALLSPATPLVRALDDADASVRLSAAVAILRRALRSYLR